jgi:hypothetical protein
MYLIDDLGLVLCEISSHDLSLRQISRHTRMWQ